jgi:RimJ/RimL family protein N-acetyltransferase
MIHGTLINLRPVTRADLELLDAWANDRDFTSEYNDFGLAPADAYSQRFAEDGMLSERQATLLIVTHAGEVVGDVTYHPAMYGPNVGSRAYNIGISIHADHRGRGYGAEAQRLLAEYLFAAQTVMRIEASTDITNIAEQRALERAGFTREGVLRKAQWRGGTWHDLVVYSKLRGE